MFKLKQLLEAAHGVEFLSVDDADNSGIDYYEDLERIRRDSNINILSDKDLDLLAVANGKIVGAMYTAFDNSNNEFSFDVIVDRLFRGKGIGRKLIDYGLGEFRQLEAEMGAKLKLDVVNPEIERHLEKRGLKVLQRYSGHAIMTT